MTLGINSSQNQITPQTQEIANKQTSDKANTNINIFSKQNTKADIDKINFGFYQNREKIAQEYKAKTGESPFVGNVKNEKDKQYNYVNVNTGGKSPVAQPYLLTIETKYKDTGTSHCDLQTRVCGQQPIKGNNVPIGNTLIAYLTNDNENTTAKIGNTNAKDLAHNFFESTDNVQAGNAPNIQTSKDGTQLVAQNMNGNGETRLIPDLNKGITNKDGKLNLEELRVAKYAYVLDAEALTAKDVLNQTDKESQKRTTSASTVNIDNDDPYDKFMDKVGKLDGKDGVTEAELEEGIKQISEPTKDGGLFFSKDKLNAFLNNK